MSLDFGTQVTYKKLMGEYPLPSSGGNPGFTLSDLREFRPSLARGLQQLLDYTEDDVEEVFSLNFVGTYEAWGEVVEVELCQGGKEREVGKENRHGELRSTVSAPQAVRC